MYEMNEEKVYIFDLDGTIADSMPIAVEIVLSLLREKGIVYPDDIVETLTPLGFKGIAKYYAEVMGVPMSEEAIFQWFMRKLERAYAEDIPLKKGAYKALEGLKARGVRMCVLTGSPHIFTDPCLKRTGIFEAFERVWSAEDFGMLKSDERLYHAVAHALGVAVENLLMIDDGVNVLKTAKAAGTRTVGVYESYSKAAEKEIKALVDKYVYSLEELL